MFSFFFADLFEKRKNKGTRANIAKRGSAAVATDANAFYIVLIISILFSIRFVQFLFRISFFCSGNDSFSYQLNSTFFNEFGIFIVYFFMSGDCDKEKEEEKPENCFNPFYVPNLNLTHLICYQLQKI